MEDETEGRAERWKWQEESQYTYGGWINKGQDRYYNTRTAGKMDGSLKVRAEGKKGREMGVQGTCHTEGQCRGEDRAERAG